MNFEMQQKYNMLKEKNRQRNAEIKYRENYLFMDCIKNLVHYKILKKEESALCTSLAKTKYFFSFKS